MLGDAAGSGRGAAAGSGISSQTFLHVDPCGSLSKEPVANNFLRLLPRFLIELFQEHEDASCADVFEI